MEIEVEVEGEVEGEVEVEVEIEVEVEFKLELEVEVRVRGTKGSIDSNHMALFLFPSQPFLSSLFLVCAIKVFSVAIPPATLPSEAVNQISKLELKWYATCTDRQGSLFF